MKLYARGFAGGLTGGQEIAWLTEEVLKGRAKLEEVLDLAEERVRAYKKLKEENLEPAKEVKLNRFRR